MRYLNLVLLLICSLTVPEPPLGLCQAVIRSPAPLTPDDCGVLLLQNGQVLTGKIARNGEFYSVTVDRGEIRLHSREVDQACNNLQEAYVRLRARCRLDNVRERLDLALWCERVGLMDEAAQELQQATALHPAHPLIPLVERRLQMALDRGAVTAEQQLPMVAANASPTPDELDRLVRGMPAGVMETFTQTIQPLLANNCTASGCHGSSSQNGFRLLRIPTGQPPSRRLTQRNLYAVVMQIDRDQLENSPLLTAPIRAHGPARAVIFTNRYSAQYQQLIAWSYLVAQGEPPSVAEVPAAIPATHLEPQGSAAMATPASHIEPTDPFPAADLGPTSPFAPPAPAKPSQVEEDDTQSPTPHPQTRGAETSDQTLTRVKRGGLPPAFVPTDPFDPEIFNRQYSPHPAASQSLPQ